MPQAIRDGAAARPELRESRSQNRKWQAGPVSILKERERPHGRARRTLAGSCGAFRTFTPSKVVRARLNFVPEPVHNFQSNEAGLWPRPQDWHAVAFARGVASMRQRAPGELGKDPARGSSVPRRQFFGGFKNVVVDV